jgi:hypothetical protein
VRVGRFELALDDRFGGCGRCLFAVQGVTVMPRSPRRC